MWMWLGSAAAASEVPAEVPATTGDEAYEERWESADLRASRAGRTGGTLIGIGFGSAAMGLLLAAYGGDQHNQDLVTTGSVLVGVGAASAFAGLPLTLAGSMRSARSMRSRGVHVPTAAGTAGWTCFGLSLLVIPAPVTVPASIVLGFLQMDVNRRFRDASGLPGVRVQLTAEF